MFGGNQIAQAGVVSLTGLILAAILFIATNALFDGSVPGARIDLTEDRLFTLSDGTEQVLAEIDEPIELYGREATSRARSTMR